jgi:hypothetical protein
MFPIFVGSSVQMGIFTSIFNLLKLVNSLKIVENSEICKLNFDRLLVRSTTTSVILT